MAAEATESWRRSRQQRPWKSGPEPGFRAYTPEQWFAKVTSLTGATRIKRMLLREGLLENRCEICGLGPEWNGEPLTLHLDHEDGNRANNAFENLRFLCPNCHSQTPTYAGRNRKKK